jgi:CheY-like chemotaxis protein
VEEESKELAAESRRGVEGCWSVGREILESELLPVTPRGGLMVPYQYHIVLVEDSEPDAFLVRESLEQVGVQCELQILTDGEQAINVLEAIESDKNKSSPNLLILDLNLPLVSGEKVLECIRQMRKCGSTPVIILEYFRKSSRLDEFMNLGLVVRNLLLRSSEASA